MAKLYVPKESGTAIIDGVECNFRESITVVEEGSTAYAVMGHILRPMKIDYPAPERVAKVEAAKTESKSK